MRKLLLLGMFALGLSSCYNTRILVGNVTPHTEMRKVGSRWNGHLIGGLIPLQDAKVHPQDVVAGYPDYMIKTNTSFLNLLVSGLTLGIYTPTQTSFYVPYSAQPRFAEGQATAVGYSQQAGSNPTAVTSTVTVVNAPVNNASNSSVQSNTMAAGGAWSGNDGRSDKYARYFNVAFVKQKLKYEDSDYSLKSDYGVSLTRGRTYFLHEPLAGLVRFGIDWTMFDLNFAGYSEEYYDRYEKETIDMYQGEIGMHAGPSVTLSPVSDLRLNGYFRYAPSFACFYDGDDFHYNYGSFFVSGFAVSYRAISVGLEGRWGKSKFEFGEDDYKEKIKMKTTGTRFFLSFRF